MSSFEKVYNNLLGSLIDAPEVDRGEWHARDVKGMPALVTHELLHTTFELYVPEDLNDLRDEYQPSLPWADVHFGERICGSPLNPPPSHKLWPYASGGNAEHIDADGKFSHTYPERYWPKTAGIGSFRQIGEGLGIRFLPGDFNDLVKLLIERPLTRQAYMPVWFPEDLTAARLGERCPCSIGYHFLMGRNGDLHCEYTLRSCDFVRHFRDDMYLTARLLKLVVAELQEAEILATEGDLVVHIGSLHCMKGDLKKMGAEYADLSSSRYDDFGDIDMPMGHKGAA